MTGEKVKLAQNMISQIAINACVQISEIQKLISVILLMSLCQVPIVFPLYTFVHPQKFWETQLFKLNQTIYT